MGPTPIVNAAPTKTNPRTAVEGELCGGGVCDTWIQKQLWRIQNNCGDHPNEKLTTANNNNNNKARCSRFASSNPPPATGGADGGQLPQGAGYRGLQAVGGKGQLCGGHRKGGGEGGPFQHGLAGGGGGGGDGEVDPGEPGQARGGARGIAAELEGSHREDGGAQVGRLGTQVRRLRRCRQHRPR